MRKFTKLVAVLYCISTLCTGLCACSNPAVETTRESSEQTERVPSDKVSSELPDDYTSINSEMSAEIETESEANEADTSGVIVTGDPLLPEQLTSFTLDCEWAEKAVENGYAGAFLDTLNDRELKELYCRALALIHIMSTENLVPADGSGSWGIGDAYIEVTDETTGNISRYKQSGYTYDSFYSVFCDAFTEETVRIILTRCPFYYSYNNGLWYKQVSAGGNSGEVYQEYELISRSDAELKFKRISYSVNIGEPIAYEPSKKDEYNKTEVNFRFVKTENGWRAAEFLNATDLDKNMLFF